MKYTYVIQFSFEYEQFTSDTVRFYTTDDVFTNKSLKKGSKLYQFFCDKYFNDGYESVIDMKITEVFENNFSVYETLSDTVCDYLYQYKEGVELLTDFFVSENELKRLCKKRLFNFEQEIAIRQYIYETIGTFVDNECLIINYLRKIVIEVVRMITLERLIYFEKMTKPTDANYKEITDETYVPEVGSYNVCKIDYDNIDCLTRNDCAIMLYYKCLHIADFTQNMLNCLLSTYFSRFGITINARSLGDYLEKLLNKIDYIMNLLVMENPSYTINYSTKLLVDNISYRSREIIIEDLCPPKYQELAIKILAEIDDYYKITNGDYDKLTLTAVCLTLKKSIIFNKSIKAFEKFKKLICEYYQVPTPSYKENDCKNLIIDIKKSYAFNNVPFK